MGILIREFPQGEWTGLAVGVDGASYRAEYEQEVRVALRSQCGTGILLPREPHVFPSRIQRLAQLA